MGLYTWLNFFHLLGVVVFFFAHGFAGATSFALRGQVTVATRPLLQLSQRASFVSNPALLVVIVTGIWMSFVDNWWHQAWPFVAIGVLVVLFVAMGLLARPYYMARMAKTDEEIGQRLSQARPEAIGAVGLVGLALLLVLMVFKPF
ncbi:MAG TPA: hypothetical protein VHO95_00715 [Candidatus Dormibacteraeota bacterium]|nr:hypothetical protein [Candidatus Dormibacteraeota bacterium]HEX2680740.1 hypothetical protein [Candidatus Dormibacteraeota bacterium]